MANLDALLRIRSDVQGANQIVALNRGLQGVERTAAGATVALRGLAGSSALMAGSLGALAPLASAAGLVGLVKNAINAGDAMYDLSQRTGVSVEALAKFRKAASTSGTDIEAVAKSLTRLSRGMFEAATTGKGAAADALKALGISAKDAAGNVKSADAVTLEIANRFKAMPDGVNKTALAMALFGKSGADMIPMLNMGGAAIDSLSVKMTKAFAERADEYSDKLAILSGKVGALGADLAIALLPALNAVTDALTAAVTGFSSMPPALQQAAVAGAALAISWGPVAGLMGVIGKTTAPLVANAMASLSLQTALAGRALGPLSAGLAMVKGAMLAIPGWGWALAGAAALTALTAHVYKTNESFRDFVGNLGDVISGDFKRSMEAMGNFAAGAGQFISDKWGQLVKNAQWAGGKIAEAFAGRFGFIVDIARETMGQVSEFISGMVNAIPKPIRDKLGMAVGNAASGALFGPIGAYAIGAVGRASSMGGRGGAAQGGGGGGGGIPAPAAAALDLSGYGAGVGGSRAGKGFQLSSQGKALVAAAGKLGVSPLDLATIIGFETGGSYSPSQRGGAGGNYMGLIQFGGPERRQYGANAGQSFEEQVQGPVVRYFQDRFRGAGMSTQGASLEDLYTTVLAGNPRANRNSRDAFGTSPRSGVAAMGPHRQEALRRFFGGSMKNLDYGADSAGRDASQGYEEERKIEEERKKKEKEAAEQTTKQLIAAGRLLTTSEAALRVAEATNPLERLSAEYSQDRARRMADYADKLQGARSEEERMALVAAQTRDIRAAEIGHQEKLREIVAQRITQEREGANALAESMARLEEITSRSSINAGFKQGIQGYVDSIGNMRDAVGQLTVDSIGGLENSLTELATTGATNFKAFAASVLQDTSRMIIRQVVLGTIMQAIGGILTPSQGAYGLTSPRSLGSYAGGGYTGNAPRSGGLDGQGGFLAIMHPRETVTDHTRGAPMAAAGGGPNITINVDATGTPAAGDRGRSKALADDLAQVIDARLIYQRLPGGILAG
jgi:lambda family phage tail tape measure protein